MQSPDNPSSRVGDLVYVNIANGIQRPGAKGKWRPAVLVRRVCGHWEVMGLTTNPRRANGSPRFPIPNFASVGLSRPGYLWGNRLANVASIDIGDHIGHADRALVEAVIATARVRGNVAARLRGAIYA